MDYEKKYKEAIERAKIWQEHLYDVNDKDYADELNYIFPELKESEDEKTKKEIINYLECQSRDEPSRKHTHNKWIGYIEKHTLSKDDYAFLRDCARVLKTLGWQSYADRLTGLCPALGEEAKTMMSTPIIFDESEDERIRKDIIAYIETANQILPQFQKDERIAWLKKQGEQKPAEWNKNDEVFLDETLHFIREFQQSDRCIDEGDMQNSITCENWLKSLKDRVQPQPKQEWSEDVESAISLLKSMAEEQERDYCPHNANHLRKAAQYLETFRPQNTWKPSDEQMKEALRTEYEKGRHDALEEMKKSKQC